MFRDRVSETVACDSLKGTRYSISKKVKGKVVPLRSIEAHLDERRYSSYCFLTSALEGGEWSASRPAPRYPLYRSYSISSGRQTMGTWLYGASLRVAVVTRWDLTQTASEFLLCTARFLLCVNPVAKSVAALFLSHALLGKLQWSVLLPGGKSNENKYTVINRKLNKRVSYHKY
jgi:hypothetical protein